jgi:homoprotocatechuate degradation regulator HpaR
MNNPIRRVEDSLPIQLLATHDKVMESFRPTLKKHDLTDQKWRVLRFIAQNQTIDRNPEFHAVAKACLLKRASLSRILVSLEKSGWVERTSDNRDKRQVYLGLTNEGQTFHDQVAIEFADVFAKVDEKLGSDGGVLLEALKKAQKLL